MATSRKTVRDALKTLFETALVGDGLPAKTVTEHKAETLVGNTPLVVVLSRSSARSRLTYQGNRAVFGFLIQVWVLQEKGTSWTQEDAEDALDSIESLIAGVCEDNRRTGNWEVIEYDGESRVFEASVAGVPYYVESIPVKAALAHN